MKKREAMTFFRSFYDAAEMLPAKQRSQLYNAIFKYMFDEVEPALQGRALQCWLLIKPVLDSSNKNRENGSKNKGKQ